MSVMERWTEDQDQERPAPALARGGHMPGRRKLLAETPMPGPVCPGCGGPHSHADEAGVDR